MSADGTTPAPPADTTSNAADQSRQAARPSDGARQNSDARQPHETRTRQEHADAMLARPPGQAHEVAVRVAPSGRDNRQAKQAHSERAPAPAPEATQNAGHKAEVRTRQDHADAMLAHPPGRAHEAAAPAVTSARDGQRAELATSDRTAASAGHHERRPAEGLAAGESPAAMPSRPPEEAGELAGEAQRHTQARHGDAPPRTEGQGDQSALPRVGQTTHSDGPLTSQQEAGNPIASDGADQTVARSGDKHAPSRDSQNGQSASSTTADSQPARLTPAGRDPDAARPEAAAAAVPGGADQDGAWTQADRDRVRALYIEDFGPNRATVGRDSGINVVGEKPDRSPGDMSDVPPSGEQLVEMEDKVAPRREKIRSALDRDFKDFDDTVNYFATSTQEILEQPPPTGHPGVVADTHSHWAPESAQNPTPGLGNLPELVLVAGVLGDRAIQWIGHKVSEKREGAKANASH